MYSWMVLAVKVLEKNDTTIFKKNTNSNPMVYFAKIRETDLWWIGFIKFLCKSIRNTELFRMSESSYNLFIVFSYNILILKFSMYPADQKTKSEWKIKEAALSNTEKHILWSDYHSHILDPPFLHHVVCSLKALLSVSAVCVSISGSCKFAVTFLCEWPGSRCAERLCRDSARAAVFLCIWLCCKTL